MKISFEQKSGKTLLQNVKDLPKQQNFAQMKAINETLKLAHTDLKAEVKRTFDNPTRFFINATSIGFATRRNNQGFIAPKDTFHGDAERIYMIHVYGGQRKNKRSETLLKERNILPARKNLVMARFGIRKNKAGNVTGGMMNKILSGLRAQHDIYQNSPFDSKNYQRWFYGEVNGVKGIWEVKGKRKKLWFLEVDRAVYKPRLKYFETINKSVNRNFDSIHARWLERAFLTAK